MIAAIARTASTAAIVTSVLALATAPAAAGGWTTTRPNFRVHHKAQDRGTAEGVADHAEKALASQLALWGVTNRTSVAGRHWSARCEIYLYRSAKEYRARSEADRSAEELAQHGVSGVPEVGVRVGSSRGRRTVAPWSGARAELSRRRTGQLTLPTKKVRLSLGRPDLLNTVTHEVAHMVQHEAFAGVRLPRWAGEGLAMVADGRPDRWARVLQAGHSAYPLRILLRSGYPRRNARVFYAQSLSLTRFLLARGGRGRLKAFIYQAARQGYDRALHDNYGLASVAQLERAWKAQAR